MQYRFVLINYFRKQHVWGNRGRRPSESSLCESAHVSSLNRPKALLTPSTRTFLALPWKSGLFSLNRPKALLTPSTNMVLRTRAGWSNHSLNRPKALLTPSTSTHFLFIRSWTRSLNRPKALLTPSTIQTWQFWLLCFAPSLNRPKALLTPSTRPTRADGPESESICLNRPKALLTPSTEQVLKNILCFHKSLNRPKALLTPSTEQVLKNILCFHKSLNRPKALLTPSTEGDWRSEYRPWQASQSPEGSSYPFNFCWFGRNSWSRWWIVSIARRLFLPLQRFWLMHLMSQFPGVSIARRLFLPLQRSGGRRYKCCRWLSLNRPKALLTPSTERNG